MGDSEEPGFAETQNHDFALALLTSSPAFLQKSFYSAFGILFGIRHFA